MGCHSWFLYHTRYTILGILHTKLNDFDFYYIRVVSYRLGTTITSKNIPLKCLYFERDRIISL